MGGELDERKEMIKVYEILKECKKYLKNHIKVRHDEINIFNSSTCDTEAKHILFTVTVCVYDVEDMCMCLPWSMCGGQRTTSQNQFMDPGD